MRIEQARDNVFTVTATSQELSALVAAARMALNAMRSAPEPPPPEALDSLEGVLADFDSARGRLTGQPPAESSLWPAQTRTPAESRTSRMARRSLCQRHGSSNQ